MVDLRLFDIEEWQVRADKMCPKCKKKLSMTQQESKKKVLLHYHCECGYQKNYIQ